MSSEGFSIQTPCLKTQRTMKPGKGVQRSRAIAPNMGHFDLAGKT